MDGLTLLEEARNAGLTVEPQGELLKVTGPKRAGALAQRLIACKEELLPILRYDATQAARLVADMLARLNSAFPGQRLSANDWAAIDRLTSVVDDARQRTDMPAFRAALVECERGAVAIFKLVNSACRDR